MTSIEGAKQEVSLQIPRGIFVRRLVTCTRYCVIWREVDGRQKWRSFEVLDDAIAFQAETRSTVRATRREIRAIRAKRRGVATDAIGHVYASTRRLAQEIDAATTVSSRPARKHLRDALDSLYAAEDAIRAALSDERSGGNGI